MRVIFLLIGSKRHPESLLCRRRMKSALAALPIANARSISTSTSNGTGAPDAKESVFIGYGEWIGEVSNSREDLLNGIFALLAKWRIQDALSSH